VLLLAAARINVRDVLQSVRKSDGHILAGAAMWFPEPSLGFSFKNE
jgi:hypothetical protein